MKYDFDRVIDRWNSYSVKWDGMNILLGDEVSIKEMLPLWVADMDFQSPKEVVEALRKHIEHGIFGYSFPHLGGYRQAVTDWMKKRHNWDIKNDWLVYTQGIVSSIAGAVDVFSDIGDNIIIQRPVYYPFSQVIEDLGRRVSNNRLIYSEGCYSIDFADLEKKAADSRATVMILCNPHNPVGRVFTREELTRTADICLRNNVILISDEVHFDLIMPGHRHYPLYTLGDKFQENTIICTAPSKTFNLPGMQISNIVIANPEMRRRFSQHFSGIRHSAVLNPLSIVAVEAAYRHGADWLNQLLEYIAGNFAYIDNRLKKDLPQVKLIEPQGTYLAWLDFTAIYPDKDKLRDILRLKARVALDEGWMFGEEGNGFARINVGCPRQTLTECMDRIIEACLIHR